MGRIQTYLWNAPLHKGFGNDFFGTDIRPCFIFRPAGGDSFDSGSNQEDLQRLYNQLEEWRLAEEKRLVTTAKSQGALQSGRAKLVTDEALKLAQLAAKRDKSMEVHKQDVIQNVIIKVRWAYRLFFQNYQV